MSAPPRRARVAREDLPGSPRWMERFLEGYNPFQEGTAAALERALTFADNVACQVVTVDAVGPQPTWTDVATTEFQNSWVPWPDASFNAPGYRIDEAGTVHLRGLAAGGTVSSTGVIFTLPTGYRPIKHVAYVTAATDLVGTGRVYTNGQVIAVAGTGTWWGLDGVSFPAGTAAAAPKRPTGSGWPLTIKRTLPRVSWVLVVKAEDLSATFGDGTTSAVSALPEWATTSSGDVQVLAVPGLIPGRKYRLTFLVLAG